MPLLELLKTFLGVQSAPVREVHFPAQLGEIYVTADDAAIKKAVAAVPRHRGHPRATARRGSRRPNEQQKRRRR